MLPNDIVTCDSRGRKVLNIDAKRRMIKLAEAGLTHQQLATMFDIGRSTVTKIIHKRHLIMDNNPKYMNDPRIRIHKDELYDLEFKLFNWCIDKGQIESIDRGKIRSEDDSKTKTFKPMYTFKKGMSKKDFYEKSKKLAKIMGLCNFEPTNRWFDKFKRKFNIRFRRCPRSKVFKVDMRNLGNFHASELQYSQQSIATESMGHIINTAEDHQLIVKSNLPSTFKIEELIHEIEMNIKLNSFAQGLTDHQMVFNPLLGSSFPLYQNSLPFNLMTTLPNLVNEQNLNFEPLLLGLKVNSLMNSNIGLNQVFPYIIDDFIYNSSSSTVFELSNSNYLL